jgi:hypothetical protein
VSTLAIGLGVMMSGWTLPLARDPVTSSIIARKRLRIGDLAGRIGKTAHFEQFALPEPFLGA